LYTGVPQDVNNSPPNCPAAATRDTVITGRLTPSSGDSPQPPCDSLSSSETSSSRDERHNTTDYNRTASPSLPTVVGAVVDPRLSRQLAAAATPETDCGLSVVAQLQTSPVDIAADFVPVNTTSVDLSSDRLSKSSTPEVTTDVITPGERKIDRISVQDRLPPLSSSPSRRDVAKATVSPQRVRHIVRPSTWQPNRSPIGSATSFCSAHSRSRCSVKSLSKSNCHLPSSSSSSSSSPSASSSCRAERRPDTVDSGAAVGLTWTNMRANGGPLPISSVVECLASGRTLAPLSSYSDDYDDHVPDEDHFFGFTSKRTKSASYLSKSKSSAAVNGASILPSTPSVSRSCNHSLTSPTSRTRSERAVSSPQGQLAADGAGRRRDGDANLVVGSFRSNARKQLSNQNSRPPEALFCLRLSNPLRQFCICFVEYKYPSSDVINVYAITYATSFKSFIPILLLKLSGSFPDFLRMIM